MHVGWVEALRELGQKVIEFDLSARLTFYGSALRQLDENTFARMLDADQAQNLAIGGLYSTLYQARPDVLLVVSGFFVPPLLLDRARRHGTRIVLVHTESPYEDDRQLALAPYADVNLVDDPTNLDRFRQAAPSFYVPKAYRPTLHHPGPAIPELACDLGFVGTGYPSRLAFFEAMDLHGLDVLLAGNWTTVAEESPIYRHLAHDPDECLPNEKAVDVYRSARVGINLYRREATRPDLAGGWSMGPREVEMAACGLFFLRDPRGEGDEVLGMLPTFSSPQEAAELLRYWLGRPEERAALAAKARDAVADRTFTNHAVDLLRLLEGND